MASFSFKRSLFGYNRAAVDRAVGSTAEELNQARIEGAKAESALTEVRGELDYTRFSLVEARKESDTRAERVRELEAVVAWLADRVVDRERELRTVRGDSSAGEDTVSDAEAVEATALPAPDPLLADFPAARRSAVDSAVQAAGERREAKSEEQGGPNGAGPAAASAPDARSGPEEPTDPNGTASGADKLWAGQVALEIGPLSDFSQLAGIEDAAGGIEGASDISVRRFSKGRATIQLSLERPVDLLRELESRSPLNFEVRDTRDDRLILDVEG